MPLVSRLIFFRVSAASRMMRLPTVVDPVKAIMSVPRLVTRASPASGPVPVTIPATPRGSREKASASARVAMGVRSAGLITTVLPAASAGATFQDISNSG